MAVADLWVMDGVGAQKVHEAQRLLPLVTGQVGRSLQAVPNAVPRILRFGGLLWSSCAMERGALVSSMWKRPSPKASSFGAEHAEVLLAAS